MSEQEKAFLGDVKATFDHFGYADDSEHKFYGNYYRHFLVSEEQHSDDDERKVSDSDDLSERMMSDDEERMMSDDDHHSDDEVDDEQAVDQKGDEMSPETPLEDEHRDSGRIESDHRDRDRRDSESDFVQREESVDSHRDSENEIAPKLEERARGSNEFAPNDIKQINAQRNRSNSKESHSSLQSIDENDTVMTPSDSQMGNGTDPPNQSRGTPPVQNGGGRGGGGGGQVSMLWNL